MKKLFKKLFVEERKEPVVERFEVARPHKTIDEIELEYRARDIAHKAQVSYWERVGRGERFYGQGG